MSAVRTPHYALLCRFLKLKLAVAGSGDVANLCLHAIREGRECVGPFLEAAETDCGLWEALPGRWPKLAAFNPPLQELPPGP